MSTPETKSILASDERFVPLHRACDDPRAIFEANRKTRPGLVQSVTAAIAQKYVPPTVKPPEPCRRHRWDFAMKCKRCGVLKGELRKKPTPAPPKKKSLVWPRETEMEPMGIQIGGFILTPLKAGQVWLERVGDEGLMCEESKLEGVLEKFFQKEF